LTLGLAVALFVPAAGLQAAESSPAATLLVLGDSLSAGYGLRPGEGWVDLAAERLRACPSPWQVVNASISGETTSGGRTRLPQLLERHRPRVVVIALGANDGLRGLSLRAMRANLEAMIDAAHRAGAAVVLVGMAIPPNLGPDYSSAFAATFAEVAKEQRVAGFVPFLLAPIALSRDAFQADGLHPTAAAQPLLLETVWPAIAPLVGCN
jgi:acyl-CoA thioesterase-1